MSKQTAILITLNPGLDVKQAAAVIEKIETEVGDDLETLTHQEYDPEHGGVVIYQP